MSDPTTRALNAQVQQLQAQMTQLLSIFGGSISPGFNLASLGFGVNAAEVPDFETTSATSFTDLTTVGPTVRFKVGASGQALVTWYASLSPVPGDEGQMGVSVDGGVVNDTNVALLGGSMTADVTSTPAAAMLVTGLTPFTTHMVVAKYVCVNGQGCQFSNRVVVVQPC